MKKLADIVHDEFSKILNIATGISLGLWVGYGLGEMNKIPVHYENKSAKVSSGFVNPRNIQKIYTEDLNKDGKPETILEYKDGEKTKKFIFEYDGQRITGTQYDVTVSRTINRK